MDLGTSFLLNIGMLAYNQEPFTVEEVIAGLNATTTLTTLDVFVGHYESKSESNRRVIEPLCGCIANLRHHNETHPLRNLKILRARNVDGDVVDQFLAAAKQFGIHHLKIFKMPLRIQSLVEFCRDNDHLKVLDLDHARISDEVSLISFMPPQVSVSSSILALDMLKVASVDCGRTLSLVTEFSNFIAHVTYPALYFGGISLRGFNDNEEETNKTCMRIVSELFKSSLEQLTFTWRRGCDFRIEEIMDVIEACATVTQIQQLDSSQTPYAFETPLQQKLQAIVTRNRELADFIVNPRAYPGNDLLALMSNFDNIPTGRYMLACHFPGIPSFFKIETTDTATTKGPKKEQ